MTRLKNKAIMNRLNPYAKTAAAAFEKAKTDRAAKRADREEYVDGNVGDQVRQYIAKKYMDDGKHYPDVDEVAKKFIELTK